MRVVSQLIRLPKLEWQILCLVQLLIFCFYYLYSSFLLSEVLIAYFKVTLYEAFSVIISQNTYRKTTRGYTTGMNQCSLQNWNFHLVLIPNPALLMAIMFRSNALYYRKPCLKFSCSNFLLLPNKSPQTQWHKTTTFLLWFYCSWIL